MKICPTCEEPIEEDQETCEDEICEALRRLIDPTYKTDKTEVKETADINL